MIKRLGWTMLLGAVLAVQVRPAGAWRPSGWVYHDYPWAYESATGDWMWFNPDTQWVVNMTSGTWATLPASALASGWAYYDWAFAFCQGNGAWHWINEPDVQWVVNMGSSAWSRFGAEEAPPGMVRVEGGASLDSFYIGMCEVTVAEWESVRDWAMLNGYDLAGVGTGCASNHPVIQVSWDDCVKWCNASSELDGRTPVYTVGGAVYRAGTDTNVEASATADGDRLPTSAEWVHAASGGTQTQGYTYSGSDTLGDVGWYQDNSGGAPCDFWAEHGTWPAGGKAANELGLYDMSGNVREWCFTSSGTGRYVLGGCWWSPANHCVPAQNAAGDPATRNNEYGFRRARRVP